MKLRLLIGMALLSTASASAQWVQSNLNPGLGRSLHTDGTTLYAATNGGVYRTTDIGNPWNSIGPQNADINQVLVIGSKILAGSLGADGVYISTNGGQDWHISPTSPKGGIRAFARNASYVFAGTWASGVYRSSDEGETWEAAGLSSVSVTTLLAVGNAVLAGNPTYGVVYKSTDNGNSWTSASLPYPASNIRSLFNDGGTLFACDIGLYVSTDMGSSWSLRSGVTFDSTGTPINTSMFRAMTRYNQFLIAEVDFQSIQVSADNGMSWNAFNDGLMGDWTFVGLAIHGPNLWILREFFGNAYRRPLSDLVTGVNEQAGMPSSFALLQNYPNPFNPKTVVSYQLSVVSTVKLAVYDILGREVAVLVNEQKLPGSYRVEFDGDGLSSGIYFYRLQAGSFVETKRMLLLR